MRGIRFFFLSLSLFCLFQDHPTFFVSPLFAQQDLPTPPLEPVIPSPSLVPTKNPPAVFSPTKNSSRPILGYLDIQLGKSYQQILDIFEKGTYQGLMIEPDRQFLRMSNEVTPKYKKRISLLPASSVLPSAFRHISLRFNEDTSFVERIEALFDNRYVSFLLAKQILSSSYGVPVLLDMSTCVWVDSLGNSLLLKRSGPTVIYQIQHSPQETTLPISPEQKSLSDLILQTLRTL